MLRIALGLAVALFATAAVADDKKKDDAGKDKPKLSGAWVREAEGFEVQFHFVKADELKIVVSNGGNGVTVKAKYSADKDGLVKATITDVEEKGDFPAKPPKGLEVSFKFKVDGKKATLSDFAGENTEGAKPVVEGEYAPKKD